MIWKAPASKPRAIRANSAANPASRSFWIQSLLAACALVFVLALHAPALAAQDPQKFVDGMAKQAFAALGDTSISEPERVEKLRTLLNASVDMPRVGRFVLGANWRRADAAQQAEYLNLFSEYVIASYAGRLKEYTGSIVRVKDTSDNGNGEYIVTTLISQPGAPQPVRVDWRVREAQGELRIIDLMIEGISMALSQRSEFGALVQSNGGDISVLLARLRDVASTIDTSSGPVTLTR